MQAASKTDGVQALRTVVGTVTKDKRHAKVDSEANGQSGEEKGEGILLRAASVDLKSPITLEGVVSE